MRGRKPNGSKSRLGEVARTEVQKMRAGLQTSGETKRTRKQKHSHRSTQACSLRPSHATVLYTEVPLALSSEAEDADGRKARE